LRGRNRDQAVPTLEPDARIGPLLTVDERVVAVRRGATFERRQPATGTLVPTGIAGDFYVTSRRLVLVGRLTLSFDLSQVEQALLSGERILVVMRDGMGFALEVEQPRLLRVEIAAARACATG